MSERLVPVATGIDLAVRERAGGHAPVLLVHGLASNRRLWTGVADELVAAGHRVVAVDLRGHGQSSKPRSGYDFPTLVADLRALMAALGLDRPVVVGQSMGGNLAVELAAADASVRAVVGVDGGAIDLRSQYPTWDACAHALAPPDLVGTPVEVLEKGLRDQHPHWAEWGIAAVLASFHVRPDGTVTPWLTRDRHLALLRALWEHRPLERLGTLAAPVTLVPSAIALPASLPQHVRVVAFPGRDHDLHVEDPVAVAKVIAEAAA